MIVIIDYNVGNVKSVLNAFRHIGCEARLSSEPETIKNASGLVLPGVAAFGFAINALGSLAKLIKQTFHFISEVIHKPQAAFSMECSMRFLCTIKLYLMQRLWLFIIAILTALMKAYLVQYPVLP